MKGTASVDVLQPVFIVIANEIVSIDSQLGPEVGRIWSPLIFKKLTALDLGVLECFTYHLCLKILNRSEAGYLYMVHITVQLTPRRSCSPTPSHSTIKEKSVRARSLRPIPFDILNIDD